MHFFTFFVILCGYSLAYSRNCVCRGKDEFNDVLKGKKNFEKTPRVPDIPDIRVPVVPIVPETPETPETPVTPETSETPETPETPGVPRISIDSSTSKELVVKNSCSFDISVGMTGSDNGPSEGEKCPDSQKYNGNGRCFWYLDTPDLLEPGEDWSVKLNAKGDHLISGTVWGTKAELMKESCPSGKCESWVGPAGAITKAEFTLSRSKTDFMDVSIIEGSNIPMNMYPNDADVDPEDRYDCGISGTGSWDFQPGNDLEKYVTMVTNVENVEKVESCEVRDDCSGDLVCGSSFNTRPPIHGICGEFQGVSTAHMNCIAGASSAPFFCESESEPISCQGQYSGSGYNSPVGSTVCGCPDWESLGIDAPPVAPCTTSDKRWEEKSLPFLIFLKKACPLCYSFAYDDMSSTVVCERSKSYTVEFCPGDTEKIFFG